MHKLNVVMSKRKTVSSIVNADASDMTKPKLTNCAAPAKITDDIAKACAVDNPALIAIEPAKIPPR